MKTNHRLVRIISAVAVAASLALTTASFPQAVAETVTGDVASLSPTSIDMAKRGRLTIHKVKPNPYDQPDSTNPIPHTAVGRELTLIRFGGIEINTKEGFERATNIDLAEAQKLPVAETLQKKTDDGGEVTFEGLVPGLYMLGEKVQRDPNTPAYYTVPTIFTIPIGIDGKWVYDFEMDSKDQVEGKIVPPKPHPPEEPVVPDESGSSVLIPLIPIIIGGFYFGSFSSEPTPPPALVPEPTPVPTPEEAPLKKGIKKTFVPAKSLPVTGISLTFPVGLGLMVLIAGLVLILGRMKRNVCSSKS